MHIQVDDILVMKKDHPCGNNKFKVLRIGMDFKLECEKCHHEFMSPREKIEKNVKQIISHNLPPHT